MFEDEINQFFAEYLNAFRHQDAQAITDLWDDVGLFPSPTGNFSMERAAFHDHCVTLLEFCRQQGVDEPMGEVLSAEQLFSGVAQVRMAYRMLGVDRSLVASWEHVYILRKTNGKWRVSLTIADEEMLAWAAIEAGR